MAKKKSEMEADVAEYRSRMAKARAAEGKGMYRLALDSAVSAWDYIDGMMQYERKYEQRDFDSVDAIDFILRYAPLLLDFRALDKLDELLKAYKRIERDTEADMGQKLADARARMWANHRLWEYLETHPQARQDELRQRLGGEQEYWRSVAAGWEKMGLVAREPAQGSYRLCLSTRLGQIVRGKCPRCGHIVEAPKAMLFERTRCPDCKAEVSFVLCMGQTAHTNGH